MTINQVRFGLNEFGPVLPALSAMKLCMIMLAKAQMDMHCALSRVAAHLVSRQK
jgi:hypothetical protein